MPRHQVVAELVGEPHHLRERHGIEAHERGRGGRRGRNPPFSVEDSARFAPQLHERAERVARRGQQHPRDAAFGALGRQEPRKLDAIPLGRGNLECHARGPAAAWARHEGDAVVDREIDRCRRRGDVHATGAGIRHEPELDGLEIDHERRGLRVVGLVRPPVEGRGILGRQCEGRIVDHDVAAQGAKPFRAQCLHEAPPALEGHVGIAAALQNEIPLEHAVLEHALHERLRVPSIGRPQRIEGGEGRHHFDGGGGAARRAGIELAAICPESTSSTTKLTAGAMRSPAMA
jgi:hypothetical protein